MHVSTHHCKSVRFIHSMRMTHINMNRCTSVHTSGHTSVHINTDFTHVSTHISTHKYELVHTPIHISTHQFKSVRFVHSMSMTHINIHQYRSVHTSIHISRFSKLNYNEIVLRDSPSFQIVYILHRRARKGVAQG